MFLERFDLDVFGTLFEEELDSWFSADIACCDACYNAYAKKWPGLAASIRFQQNFIPLDAFYSGSRLTETYTEQEFLEFCRKMGCPVCSQPLYCNIWAYNPSFDVPQEFGTQMEELKSLAARTPFLALRHPLARKVLREIRKVSVQETTKKLESQFFRARQAQTPRQPQQFLAPKASECKEGRYNHAGQPVLYLASDRVVAFEEVNAPKEGVLIGSIWIKTPQKVLDLTSDKLPSDILQAVTASALLSAPTEKEGWEKPEYTFSRFIADCATDCGFTGLCYPSVAEPEGFNLVLFAAGQDWQEIVTVVDICDYPQKEAAEKTPLQTRG